MTLEDAQKVADIVASADGGCSTCVAELVEFLQEAFPDFVWVVDKARYPPVVAVRHADRKGAQ